ncbi:MAG TPA: substrate-binding domain-containing protein [Chthoniobacteraceae bacterium]|nr:substrate-binding domain-containing protein [Chthoniobacteraceae bacterium]
MMTAPETSPGTSAARVDDGRLALERVMRHVDAEFLSGKLPPGNKLPPVRAVARQLGVSAAMVHAVYRQLQEEGKVVSAVGRGTFLAADHQPPSYGGRGISLALSIPFRPGRAPEFAWPDSFVAAMMKMAGRSEQRFSIRPLPGSEQEERSVGSDLLAEMDEVDGMILFPSARDVGIASVVKTYEAAGKPVVSINPPTPIATENFVSADYYGFGWRLGKAWVETGRRRVLFLTPWPLEHSASATLRLNGFFTALSGTSAALRVEYPENATKKEGYRKMAALLASGYVPDAVFAFGDLLAFGALEALREHGLRVPEEVSLVGGTGISLAAEFDLSTNRNPYFEIADAVLKMVAARIQSGGAPLPGRYLPFGFDAAGTTREVEHRAWEALA